MDSLFAKIAYTVTGMVGLRPILYDVENGKAPNLTKCVWSAHDLLKAVGRDADADKMYDNYWLLNTAVGVVTAQDFWDDLKKLQGTAIHDGTNTDLITQNIPKINLSSKHIL